MAKAGRASLPAGQVAVYFGRPMLVVGRAGVFEPHPLCRLTLTRTELETIFSHSLNNK